MIHVGGRGEKLPIKVSAKTITDEGFVETVYSEVFPVATSSKIPDITDRELDILRNLATGKTSKQECPQNGDLCY